MKISMTQLVNLRNKSLGIFTNHNKILTYKELVSSNQLTKLRESISDCILYEKDLMCKNQTIEPGTNFVKHFKSTEHVRNILMRQAITIAFMKHLHFNKRMKFHISPRWWKFFENAGISINKPLSLFLWIIYFVKKIFVEYIKLFRSLNNYIGFVDINIEENSTLSLYCTRDNFRSEKNTILLNFDHWLKLNTKDKGLSKYYYLQEGKKRNSKHVVHNELTSGMIFSESVLGIFKSFYNLLKQTNFSLTLLLQIIIFPNSFFEFFSLDHQKFQRIRYIFAPSSGSWVKPLWLYQAENFGAKVIYVNLSADLVPWQDRQPSHFNWYHLSAWKNVWSACELQSRQLEESNLDYIDTNCKIVGVPDWVDTNTKIVTSEDFVSIFDIEPHLLNFGQTSLNDFGYSNIEHTLKFLTDLAEVSSSLGLICLHKSKRSIGSRRYQEYSETIKMLEKRYPGFKSVDENIAPRRLISRSKFAVSMPFTSTAFIAEQAAVKSCFYDPSELISIDDVSSHGIPIITSKSKLYTWLDLSK